MKTAEGNEEVPLVLVGTNDDNNLIIQDRLLNRTIVFTEAQAKELYVALDNMYNIHYTQEPE